MECYLKVLAKSTLEYQEAVRIIPQGFEIVLDYPNYFFPIHIVTSKCTNRTMSYFYDLVKIPAPALTCFPNVTGFTRLSSPVCKTPSFGIHSQAPRADISPARYSCGVIKKRRRGKKKFLSFLCQAYSPFRAYSVKGH